MSKKSNVQLIINTDFFHHLCRNIFETVEDGVSLEKFDAVLAGAPVSQVQLSLQPVHHLPVLAVPEMSLVAVKMLKY